jgi:hypothetical protein
MKANVNVTYQKESSIEIDGEYNCHAEYGFLENRTIMLINHHHSSWY